MKLLLTWALVLTVGCAVEAGNPTEESNGTVKVAMAGSDESSLSLIESNANFTLYISSITLLGYSDSEQLAATLIPAVKEINLFDSTDSIELASQAVKPGSYEKIVVNLAEDRPFFYAPDGGTEESLSFDDNSHRSFIIEQEILIESGSDETILIEIDRSSSIETVAQKKIFRPKVRPFRKKHVFDYQGQVSRDDGILVCAYLYEVYRKPLPQSGNSGKRPPQPPPPPGVDGKKPTEFSAKTEVILDATKRCENAFARTRIQSSGEYSFPRLKPGKYRFRAFYNDGTFSDEAEDISLAPSEPNLSFKRRL